MVDELEGGTKKKESVLGLVRARKFLQRRFGSVFVNFGEPIPLEGLLDERRPGWREEATGGEERPGWVQPLVRDLGRQIMEGINSAAAVNGCWQCHGSEVKVLEDGKLDPATWPNSSWLKVTLSRELAKSS